MNLECNRKQSLKGVIVRRVYIWDVLFSFLNKMWELKDLFKSHDKEKIEIIYLHINNFFWCWCCVGYVAKWVFEFHILSWYRWLETRKVAMPTKPKLAKLFRHDFPFESRELLEICRQQKFNAAQAFRANLHWIIYVFWNGGERRESSRVVEEELKWN